MFKKIANRFHQFNKSLKGLSPVLLAAQAKSLLQADASPHQLAQGFALGTFISILPTPGLNILLATVLLATFKQLNKAALFAALTVWNTLVVAPLYALSSKLGALFFATKPLIAFDLVFGTYLNTTVKHFLVGNVVLAAGITIASYLLVQTAVSLHRQRKPACKVASVS